MLAKRANVARRDGGLFTNPLSNKTVTLTPNLLHSPRLCNYLRVRELFLLLRGGLDNYTSHLATPAQRTLIALTL